MAAARKQTRTDDAHVKQPIAEHGVKKAIRVLST